MFSRASFLILATVILGLFSQVHAHAAVSPMLGVNGTPVRNNVKRPSTANPCGAGINVANSINNAQAVTAAADGSFTVTAIAFNGGVDGSRQMTAQVSANGRGQNFVAATVTKNGDRAPARAGNQQITAKLPANTRCTGGTAGNRCLVQFRSVAGFGNCVVVQQGAAGAGAGANARQGGTRAARAMLAEIAERGEEAIEVVKRKASQWIWA
ncbi:hypothetical protein FA13DRAFT_1740121 [Coprinellus micaceus]|uniref:Gas1-like protein n=1 Tax=Coprinellus micaceus TaxID=71717 RepID=A0A4Y7SQ53_COPMI|nr:hypothetical protein FA13DRAFT_1740121 [Coprinellus micaceus]